MSGFNLEILMNFISLFIQKAIHGISMNFVLFKKFLVHFFIFKNNPKIKDNLRKWKKKFSATFVAPNKNGHILIFFFKCIYLLI